MNNFVKEFHASQFSNAAQWFHFCGSCQLEICETCHHSARQTHSSVVDRGAWRCQQCAPSHLCTHRDWAAPPTKTKVIRTDDGEPTSPDHKGVGSKEYLQPQAKESCSKTLKPVVCEGVLPPPTNIRGRVSSMLQNPVLARFLGSPMQRVASLLLISVFTITLFADSFERYENHPIDALYLQVDNMDILHDQKQAIRALRNLFISNQALSQNPVPFDDFLLGVSGILDDQQFMTLMGKPKSERQKLRYQLRQIRAEMAGQGTGLDISLR